MKEISNEELMMNESQQNDKNFKLVSEQSKKIGLRNNTVDLKSAAYIKAELNGSDLMEQLAKQTLDAGATPSNDTANNFLNDINQCAEAIIKR